MRWTSLAQRNDMSFVIRLKLTPWQTSTNYESTRYFSMGVYTWPWSPQLAILTNVRWNSEITFFRAYYNCLSTFSSLLRNTDSVFTLLRRCTERTFHRIILWLPLHYRVVKNKSLQSRAYFEGYVILGVTTPTACRPIEDCTHLD